VWISPVDFRQRAGQGDAIVEVEERRHIVMGRSGIAERKK
jgi:hypothetical protein